MMRTIIPHCTSVVNSCLRCNACAVLLDFLQGKLYHRGRSMHNLSKYDLHHKRASGHAIRPHIRGRSIQASSLQPCALWINQYIDLNKKGHRLHSHLTGMTQRVFPLSQIRGILFRIASSRSLNPSLYCNKESFLNRFNLKLNLWTRLPW